MEAFYMKNFLASAIVIILMTICFSLTVHADEGDELPDYVLFATNINSTYENYIGNSVEDFDLNEDDLITAHDLSLAKREMLEGNPCITKATIKKMIAYLTNQTENLKIVHEAYLNLNESDEDYNTKVSWLKNLNSSDFRIVKADICTVPGDLKISYLGIDEYIMETLIIPYTSAYFEDDEVIVETKDFKIICSSDDNSFMITDAPKPILHVTGRPLLGYNFTGATADYFGGDFHFVNDLMKDAQNVVFLGEDHWYFTTPYVDVYLIALPADDIEKLEPGFYLFINKDNEVRVVYY